MSFDNICLISWPAGKEMINSYIILGKLYDHSMLQDILLNLKYLYPFQIINKQILNEEDFKHFRLAFKITTTLVLHDTDTDIFRTPILYNFSTNQEIKNIKKIAIPKIISTKLRLFVIFPYLNPITRGKILDTCISMIKNYNPIFILTGNAYGKNIASTKSLMKRYLLSQGISNNNLIKTSFDISLDNPELVPALLSNYKDLDCDVFIASKSKDMYYLMDSYRSLGVKYQYLCE